MIGLEAEIETVARLEPMRLTGRVSALRGMTIMVDDLPMPVGSLVRIERSRASAHDSGVESTGEVVGFDGPRAIVMMLSSTTGVRSGDRVVGLHTTATLGVAPSMLGRVVNGLGTPIDGLGPIRGARPRPLDPEPLSAMARRRVTQPLYTGVRAIDLMTTLGCGQRIGVFAGPGVGKSTLLGSIARNTSADVSVIALIGERGREVQDFLEQVLGKDGLARSVVVVATSDESPLMRSRAALAACTIAESFRDAGKSVLLVMDSVTRFAHARRQIGLSVGEPPATRGYTPSVFAAMARLLERAGALANSPGSITGVYSILVEGDDMTEPVADAARGILDGHIMLSRTLAQRGHYPAIDVLDSVSRVADEVCEPPHTAARQQVVRLLAAFKQVEDLVQIGAYAKGSNAVADVAMRYIESINDMLRQSAREPRADPAPAFAAARSRMIKLAIESGSAIAQSTGIGAGNHGGGGAANGARRA